MKTLRRKTEMKHRIERQYRETISINDFWYFKTDPQKAGEDENWVEISKDDWDKLYVPANWNEQAAEYQWYMGTAWYAREFYVPDDWEGKLCWIHFEAVLYRSKVWVNGIYLGEYEGGYLPFEFRVEGCIRFGGENQVVIEVNNELNEETIPASTPKRKPGDRFGQVLDFFHYGGIHRHVYLRCSNDVYIEDTTIVTDIDGKQGIVSVDTVIANQSADMRKVDIALNVLFHKDIVREFKTSEIEIPAGSQQTVSVKIVIDDAHFWDFDNPDLYNLQTVLMSPDGDLDLTDERFGIRTIAVEKNRVLLNGRPVLFKAASGHEDFPILGKAVNGAILRRDYDLLKGLGANSFRTTHYPYTREHLDMADELGFLVIDELTWLQTSYSNPVVKEKMERMLGEMIRRDKNHPSIFMYSVTDEPLSLEKDFRPFLKDLVQTVRKADPTRLVTYTSDSFHQGDGDRNFDLVDVICHNSYYGWYEHYENCQGDIDRAIEELSLFLDRVHAEYPEKPFMMTEFGADAIAGFHSDPPEMWTEEYQAELLERTINVIFSKPYMSGATVWTLCDYRTPQSYMRTIHNRKGMFTRTREPKMSANVVRKIFTERGNYLED